MFFPLTCAQKVLKEACFGEEAIGGEISKERKLGKFFSAFHEE
jgi:hypothetical protein